MESDENVSNPGSKAPSASAPTNSDNKKRTRIRRQSQARSRSSNSSSSDSSSSSSSSSSDSSPRRSTPRHRNKKRGGKRRHRRHDSRKFRKLTRQIDDLRNQLVYCNNKSVPCSAVHFNENIIDGNVSGELYEDSIVHSVEVPTPAAQSDFTFEIETKLKEPSIPKTPQEFLQTLKDLQHLDSSVWCEVRYAETQKLYNSTPGFIDLEMNEEIKAYDSLRHLAHADKAFAALTFCILKQREALQTSVRSFLQWARGSDLSYEGINEKVNELFLKGDFFKVSSDLLQLTCGHRAEVIQMRRDGITNHVRDPLVKTVLRKIPPSCHHVFNAESLATALEKAGGVRKAFLPVQKPGSSASVSQTGQSKLACRPSQGQALRNVPSQGTAHGCCAPTHISHAYNQPSQGYCNGRPSQGHGSNHDNTRPSFSGGSRGSSFRGRGGRQGYRQQDNKNSRKRAASTSENYNRNKKRARLWLAAAGLQLLLLSVSCSRHYRRSMPAQATLPVSKGGWRPVVGSGGLVYGSYGTASLHSPTYKHPLSVMDLYQSSSRPVVARDSAKLTSIAQSYRPTTLRTVQTAQPAPPSNQPINSYHNPFVFTNNGVSYKYIQNYPGDSVVIRNPQNPYAARPIYKYPNKIKQQQPLQNTVLQQLTNVQPIQFGQYQTSKPLDVFGKPVEGYARPTENKLSQSGTEIFKPEVFKLQDSEPAPQQVSQQVKTAQQQQVLVGTQKTPLNLYPQYTYQNPVFPPNILGTFGSFGLQSVKGRDPVYSPTKTTYLPPQPNKQTIFNSFSYSPSYTPTFFSTTTPRLQTTANHIPFVPTIIDYSKNTPTPSTKLISPPKIDPNAGNKVSFKASPQDPFINKHYLSDYNKIAVTTYNPIQTTTAASNHFDYPLQQNAQIQNYYDQQTQNYNYQKKKQKIHDSIAAGVNQATHQYASPPKSRPTYEVIETTESDDILTHSSPFTWNHPSYDSNPKTTEETVTKQLHPDTGFSKQTTTPVADQPDEYAIVTEAEKGYENSLGYDSEVESQSRRPLGDDFEPIGKHKLKDYYYKVSTPSYDDYSTSKRTKKPTESSKLTTQPEVTTYSLIKETIDDNTEALPTLAPFQHFKRPSTTDTPIDKEKIRKRNKNRRRRPPLANINQNKEGGTSTRKYVQSTTELPQTTESDDVYTIRPRIRPAKLKQQSNLTTPSVTTDSTTSAVPTISPTAPTIIKKKLVRRPLTTVTNKIETTTQSFKDDVTNKDSSIMKIANRLQYPKLSSPDDIPDFSHKQDEKDTPTSDVDVSLESIKTSAEAAKSFAFHKDVKPIEAKLETTTEYFRVTFNEPTESTSTSRSETTSGTVGKIQRPRLKNKYNRTRFSVKDYRNRLSSTTSTTERSTESTPKLRFPQKKTTTEFNIESETTTERKKFMPKDPRHKVTNGSELNEETEDIHSIRHSARQRQTTTAENAESTTQKISSRIRNGIRRPKPTEETTETTSPTTVHSKRPLRKKISDSEIGESVQDISVTDSTVHYDHKNDITSERTRSESAIMKIADKKHHDHHIEHLFEHSKRVSDLTLAASKDYNTPGMFKTVSSNSRRIPNYFTIATDDPILPIEAFFPQLNQKKES